MDLTSSIDKNNVKSSVELKSTSGSCSKKLCSELEVEKSQEFERSQSSKTVTNKEVEAI